MPASMVTSKLTGEIHSAAGSELHPYFAKLVQSTPNPFIQSIFDVVVPRMAFGRACLVGDAAFVLRPHAAGATAKAAADAMRLASALADPSRDLDTALQAWEDRQLDYGRRLVDHTVALGRRSIVRHDGTGRTAPTLRDTAERFSGIAQMPRRE